MEESGALLESGKFKGTETNAPTTRHHSELKQATGPLKERVLSLFPNVTQPPDVLMKHFGQNSSFHFYSSVHSSWLSSDPLLFIRLFIRTSLLFDLMFTCERPCCCCIQ